MKKIIILGALLLIFCSCSNDTVKAITADFQGKWELYQMSGRTTNSNATGTEMEWQEYYIFNTDGSFIKSRTRNGIKTETFGAYVIKEVQEESFLELSYQADSEIIGSCYGNNKEELYVLSNAILSSTWKNCDGPGLEYKKAN